VTPPPGIVKGSRRIISGLGGTECADDRRLDTNKLLNAKEKWLCSSDLMAKHRSRRCAGNTTPSRTPVEGVAPSGKRRAGGGEARDHRLLQEGDGMLGELTQLKDDIRQLVDRYSNPPPTQAGLRPGVHRAAAGAPRRSHRCDHVHREGLESDLARRHAARFRRSRKRSSSPPERRGRVAVGWAQMLHEDYDDALGTSRKS